MKTIVFLLAVLSFSPILLANEIDKFAIALEDISGPTGIQQKIVKHVSSLFKGETNVLRKNLEKLSKKISQDDMKEFLNNSYPTNIDVAQATMPLIFLSQDDFDDLLAFLDYGADIDQKISTEGDYKGFDLIEFNLVHDLKIERIQFVLNILEKYKQLKNEDDFKKYLKNILDFIVKQYPSKPKLRREIFGLFSIWAQKNGLQWLFYDLKQLIDVAEKEDFEQKKDSLFADISSKIGIWTPEELDTYFTNLLKNISADNLTTLLNMPFQPGEKNKQKLPLIFKTPNIEKIKILLKYGASLNARVQSEGEYKGFDLLQYSTRHALEAGGNETLTLFLLGEHRATKTKEYFEQYMMNFLSWLSTTKILADKNKNEWFQAISTWAETNTLQWLVDAAINKLNPGDKE